MEDFISIILKDDDIQLLCVYNLDGDDLKVHDKSKEDDLKEHVVHQRRITTGTSLQIFRKLHLYFCKVSSPGKSGSVELYKFSRDQDKCKEFIWKVRKFGLFGYEKDNMLEKNQFFLKFL